MAEAPSLRQGVQVHKGHGTVARSLLRAAEGRDAAAVQEHQGVAAAQATQAHGTGASDERRTGLRFKALLAGDAQVLHQLLHGGCAGALDFLPGDDRYWNGGFSIDALDVAAHDLNTLRCRCGGRA
jgi:hypothetical protein